MSEIEVPNSQQLIPERSFEEKMRQYFEPLKAGLQKYEHSRTKHLEPVLSSIALCIESQ